MADRFNAKDALADYVTVPQRIAQFYELFGTGRLVTGEVRVEMGPDEKPRVIVQAFAYRTPDDPLPGIGWSWMELPGTTAFTRGSELENTETSAWGRAIAALGILVDRSVASANEVAIKSGSTPRPTTHEATTDGGLIGTAQIGDPPADYQLREEPEGWALSFKLMDGRKGFRVVARDDLAQALAVIGSSVIGQRVTCWGRMGTASFSKDGKDITYNVLDLERIASADFMLPALEAPGEAPKAQVADAGIEVSDPAAAPDPEIDGLPMFADVA